MLIDCCVVVGCVIELNEFKLMNAFSEIMFWGTRAFDL